MTPSWLAKDMIALADISSHHSILEPSAGTGAIVVELEKRYGCGTVLALELNKECYKQLAIVTECGKINADFLKYQFEYVFDRVVMNPPHRRCVEHVVKAASLLTDRGRLVALIHATYADEIAKHLRDVRFYYLPRETFVLEGNYVEACIAVFDKGDLDV
jgi:tRNA1(Val) A37 N6-methylase TrmN6